jgi:hypothetical protein
MEEQQPQFYASLASHLSAEDQAGLQSIMAKASENAQAQLLAQQQVEATAQAANGGAA